MAQNGAGFSRTARTQGGRGRRRAARLAAVQRGSAAGSPAPGGGRVGRRVVSGGAMNMAEPVKAMSVANKLLG